MGIKNKELFLEAMYNLSNSAEVITCDGGESLEDFLEFARKADKEGPNFYNEDGTKNETGNYDVMKSWICAGPVFILFNKPGLMDEVQEYIDARRKDYLKNQMYLKVEDGK